MTAIRQSIEVPIEFDGQRYEVTPDFRTVNALEQRKDFSFGRLSEGVDSSSVQVTDLAWLLHISLACAGHKHPNGQPITLMECGQAVLDTPRGMQVAAEFAREFIFECFTPGPEAPLDLDGESEPGKAAAPTGAASTG